MLLSIERSDFDLLFSSGSTAAFTLVDALARLSCKQLRRLSDQIVEMKRQPTLKRTDDNEINALLEQVSEDLSGFDLHSVEVVVPEGDKGWGRQ